MPKFSPEDLEIFAIPGFEERMGAIRESIHPRLKELGEELAGPLAAQTGEPMFAHVAKHARRSVNPPEDTWVAFGPEKRGYKKYPYVGVAISRFGIHTQVVCKQESWENRPAMADRLDARRPAMRLGNFQDWKFTEAPPEAVADDEFWEQRLHKMRLKTGGLDLGRTVGTERSDPDPLLEELQDFTALYRILRGLE
ncbi:DUF1054 family protein [Thiohalorhabdus methylotrophus]|uniref:DUF1054 family protein n=1 Tax=Thiohalorhabdus methylotrophus TaxID=3242694 RepID=A0ABV4TSQ3_9GAMM